MFVSWISSLETKRKMPNSCPSLVFLRFLQTAGDEEDEVLSNSCSNKLGSKTQPQMAAVPQAKSKPYHWLCLGTWRRQHLTLEKSTYLIMILLFYVLSIWWNLMEVIWNLFFLHLFTILRYIVVYIIVWSDSCILMCLVKAWSLPCLFHCRLSCCHAHQGHPRQVQNLRNGLGGLRKALQRLARLDAPRDRRKKSGSWNMLRPQMGQFHFNFGMWTMK